MPLSFNLVDGTAPSHRAVFHMFARPVPYTRHATGAVVSIPASVTGVRSENLFGSAAQGDVFAQVDAADFRALFGPDAVPQKFDRVRTMGMSYAVEDWRGAPNDDAPVFFKLHLRGGSQ